MKEIQPLINAQKYEEALKILSEIGMNDPDRRDEVFKYVDKIMWIQEQINTLKQNIINELYANYDDEKAFSYMEELKKIAPQELKFVEETYTAMRIIKIRKEFNRYMDTAYQYITQSQFKEAIDTYKNGFSLQREEFFQNTSYGNIAFSNVQALFIEFDAIVAEYYSRAEILDRDIAGFGDLLSENRDAEGLKKADVIYNGFLGLLSLRERMISVGKRFIAQNESIKKSQTSGKGDNFIFYSYQVILGRAAGTQREGVFYVIEKNWEILQDKLVAIMKADADTLFGEATRYYKAGAFDNADEKYVTSGALYSRTASCLAQYVNTASATAPQKIDEHDKEVSKSKLPLYYYFVERAIESRQYRNLMSTRKIYDNISTRSKTDDTAMRQSQKEIREIIVTLGAQGDFWKNREVFFKNLSEDGLPIAGPGEAVPEIIGEVGGLLASYKQLDLAYSVIFAEREYFPLRDSYAEKEKRFAETVILRQGSAVAGDTAAVKKYPSRALEIYNKLTEDLDQLNASASAFITKWTGDYEYVVKDAKVQGFVTAVADIEKNLAILREKIAKESGLANEQITRATSKRNQGDHEYSLAKDSFARKDYTQTKENLDRAAAAYTSSLADEENAEVRNLLENDLKRLDSDLYQATQNQRLIEIRNNIEQAKELYKMEIFDRTEKLLLNARKLQEELSGEKDDEIEYWLSLVEKALTMQPKREILETDPLYAEMTTRYNLAREDYNAGVDLAAKGNSAEATKLFQSAVARLDSIQIEFPYNRESGVLRLKIIQAQNDKEKFNKYFTDKMVQARDVEINTNLRQAYADLKDLQEIDPYFPGLQDAINLVDSRIVIKIEPTSADIAESNRLYEQALSLYNTRVRDNYRDASTSLSQALVLNPNNVAARNLKDAISRELNVGGEYLISNFDLQRLLAAEDLYRSGDIHGADTIVRQLKLNPQNQNNPRILSLERKIKSKLQ